MRLSSCQRPPRFGVQFSIKEWNVLCLHVSFLFRAVEGALLRCVLVWERKQSIFPEITTLQILVT